MLTVTPITNRLPFSELSYFTKEPVLPGALVAITIGSKEVPALVLSVSDANAIKQSLRTSSFTLKKIKRVISSNFFLPNFMSGVAKASEWYGTSIGTIIKALTPAAILDQPATTKETKFSSSPEERALRSEIKVIQQTPAERLASYKGIIRESLAKNQSVLVIFPGAGDIAQAAPILSRGLEDYVQIFSGTETKLKTRAIWEKALNLHKPVVVIGTPLILSLPRADIGLVILDQENSSHYKQFNPPFFDLRRLVKCLAASANWQLLLGDSTLSIETLYQAEKHHYATSGTLTYRAITNAKTKLIDGRSQVDNNGKKIFTLISDEAIKLIDQNCSGGGSAFIFTARKGLAPTTICNDCGTTVVCPTCQAPLVVHRLPPTGGTTKNIFYCHQCGVKREIDDKCNVCGSWRLATLGIATERLAETLKQIFPDRTIKIIDSDHTPTPAKIKSSLEILNQPGSIVVGTEQALNYLPPTIPLIAIIGIDSLFMIPAYQMNERIFNLLIDLKSRASQNFFIQTRHPDTPLLEQALEGNILDFYRQELALRQKLGYPPSKLLIKGTLIESKNKTSLAKAVDHLTPWQPLFYESDHFILKVDPATWPDDRLLNILAALKPAWQIDIEPTSLM